MSHDVSRGPHLPAVVLIASVLLFGASRAPAAPTDGGQAAQPQKATQASPPPQGGAATLRRIAISCADDVARLCPELSDGATSRDAAICLKAYQVDLSLSCRAAIRAVTR